MYKIKTYLLAAIFGLTRAFESPRYLRSATFSAALMLLVFVVDSRADTIVVSTTIQAAVDAADEFRPEVVILDLDMPRMDGYDAARRIADRPWAKEVLLLALTGWGQEADRARVERAGFHRHLIKPVEPEALAEILAQTGSRRQR